MAGVIAWIFRLLKDKRKPHALLQGQSVRSEVNDDLLYLMHHKYPI